MIDGDGFRANVGIILSNTRGQLLWARRIGCHNAWQFPQGGIHPGESPTQALYRELHEEIGLQPEDVKIIDVTRGWLKYRLPKHFIRTGQTPLCIGQKQRWFLLQLLTDDRAIALDQSACAEFDQWRWVSYWYPVDQVIAFKRTVYRRALKALSPAHCQLLQQAL
ncbi:MAG: RNA pyrophosphohydrolase [Cellvibrionaceae bacterium]|nr:RNA pyrophosphohydrolase [Cellvibrionaceae bacterium]